MPRPSPLAAPRRSPLLARVFGDDGSFTMETLAAVPGSGLALAMCDGEGLKLGSSVADYVLVNYLREAG
jgi:hypothetical protein